MPNTKPKIQLAFQFVLNSFKVEMYVFQINLKCSETFFLECVNFSPCFLPNSYSSEYTHRLLSLIWEAIIKKEIKTAESHCYKNLLPSDQQQASSYGITEK